MLTTSLRVRLIKEVEVDGLGDRIRQARLSSDKTLDEICRHVGISKTYWYDMEKGVIKGTVSVENLRRIERVLGVDFGVELQ